MSSLLILCQPSESLVAPTDFQEKERGAKERNSKASCQVHSYEWLMQNELNICYKVQKYSAEAQSFQVR